MLDLIRGQITRAWIVGLVRGLIEAAVMAGIMFAAATLTALDFGTNTMFIVPLMWSGIRTLEGVADHIDENTTRAPANTPGSTPFRN